MHPQKLQDAGLPILRDLDTDDLTLVLGLEDDLSEGCADPFGESHCLSSVGTANANANANANHKTTHASVFLLDPALFRSDELNDAVRKQRGCGVGSHLPSEQQARGGPLPWWCGAGPEAHTQIPAQRQKHRSLSPRQGDPPPAKARRVGSSLAMKQSHSDGLLVRALRARYTKHHPIHGNRKSHSIGHGNSIGHGHSKSHHRIGHHPRSSSSSSFPFQSTEAVIANGLAIVSPGAEREGASGRANAAWNKAAPQAPVLGNPFLRKRRNPPPPLGHEQEREQEQERNEKGPPCPGPKTSRLQDLLLRSREQSLSQSAWRESSARSLSGKGAAPVVVPSSADEGLLHEGCSADDSLLHRSCLLFPNSRAVVETALRVDPDAVRRSVVVTGDAGTHTSNNNNNNNSNSNKTTTNTNSGVYGYPINLALASGASEAVLRTLVEAGPDVLAQKDGTSRASALGILLSLQRCDLFLVDLLLSANPACAGVADRKGNYPLHLAVRYARSSAIVRAICSACPGAQGLRNFHSQTPLDLAVQSTRCPEDVTDVLRSGACQSETSLRGSGGPHREFLHVLEDGLDDIMRINCS